MRRSPDKLSSFRAFLLWKLQMTSGQLPLYNRDHDDDCCVTIDEEKGRCFFWNFAFIPRKFGQHRVANREQRFVFMPLMEMLKASHTFVVHSDATVLA
jgi:hypothetical protein